MQNKYIVALACHYLPGGHTFWNRSLYNTSIHQTCQWMGFSPSIRIPSHIASDSLHIVKSFLIYDCCLCVLKYHPVILRYIMAFLILEMLSGLEVHCMTKILSFLQNTCNSRRTPAIRIFDFFYSASYYIVVVFRDPLQGLYNY